MRFFLLATNTEEVCELFTADALTREAAIDLFSDDFPEVLLEHWRVFDETQARELASSLLPFPEDPLKFFWGLRADTRTFVRIEGLENQDQAMEYVTGGYLQGVEITEVFNAYDAMGVLYTFDEGLKAVDPDYSEDYLDDDAANDD